MTELALHRSIIDYINHVLPDHCGFHIPNGERRDARTAAKLKSMGVRAGVPDFALPYHGGRILFLEFKAGKGRASVAQNAYFDRLRENQHTVAIVRSIDDVLAALNALGIKTRDPGP